MIRTIYNDTKAFPILAHSLEEEGVSIEFEGSLLDSSGDLNHDKVVILKPDRFYNTRDFATPPKSVDGVIIVQENNETYIYIAELKSSRSKHIKRLEIQEKFDTIFQNFFTVDFSHIFEETTYEIKTLRLWLVCDPLQIRQRSRDQREYIEKAKKIKERLKGLLSEITSGLRPYKYKGVQAAIEPMLSPPSIHNQGYTDILA